VILSYDIEQQYWLCFKSTFMEILILLENTEKDKEKIQNALEQFECSLIIEGGKVIIKTSSLINDIDINDNGAVSQVWEDVKGFIDIINGSAIVEDFLITPVILHYIKYVDVKGKIQFLPNIGNMYAVLPSIRGSKPDISKFIPLALTDKAVAKALRLCSRELDWSNLYRIYEVISEDVNGITDNNIKVFKASANNSNVTGDYSRHGKMNVDTPKESMRLADAQHLIKSKVREWVHNKISAQINNNQHNKANSSDR